MSTAIAPQNDMAGDQVRAVASLPPDVMLLKMENEQIFSVARAAPREPLKIVAQLQALIDAYPQAADEAIYSKPVGTVYEIACKCGVKYEVTKIENDTVCPACDARYSPKEMRTRKVKKFAEGLSIRAAESIRSIYGYTRLATTTEELPDGKVKLTGVLVDYAAGNLTSDERIVSPMYRSRGGQMVRTPEDRFLNVVVKAEKSKLRRDVILDNTPNIVKAMFRDACEKKMAALVAPEIVAQKIIPAFAQYGITPDHLDKIIGKPHKLGWSEAERLECRKILTALKNEETTVRELLDGLDDKPGTPAGAAGASAGATVEDLAPKANGTGKAPQTQPGKPTEPADDPLAEWPAAIADADSPAMLDDYRKQANELFERGTLNAAQHAQCCQWIESKRTALGKPAGQPASGPSAIARYRELLAQQDNINAVNGLNKKAQADAALSQDEKLAFYGECMKRNEAVRGSRGSRSNKP